ncbi:MAG: hypothetical protein QNJ19_08560 [Woeseiaceae bacterium]|nr:hypothetical protein [Woeseiaceae bacterium]
MKTNAAKAMLLTRLQQIADELAAREGSLALLGLGSVGRETDRLDEFSDLDFFVIVEPGYKAGLVDSLDWLEAIRPLGFSFRNTIDGHKALFDDGIFCEFAVFEPAELKSIPFEPGRVVWSRSGFDAELLAPPPRRLEFGEADEEFLIGELLTNLYVGLGRYARGEKLSAFFFVQHHAVVRLIALFELWDGGTQGSRDSFSNERRLEKNLPRHAELIESVTPGYWHTPEAAERMLEFLAPRTKLNELITGEIRDLIADTT